MKPGTASRWTDRLTFLFAFVRTRWGYRFCDRDALLAHQARRLHRFTRHVLPRAAFYRECAAAGLCAVPVVGKSEMLANFAGFNTLGIDHESALAMALHAEDERDFTPVLPHGVSVGLSTGTSGSRSLFLASERERHVWAGTILARTLSPVLLRRLCNPLAPPVRVALFLRSNNTLYQTVDGRRMAFRFFDLLEPLRAHLATVDAFRPDVLIAPPSVLHALAKAAEAGTTRYAPRQVISVADVLEPADRALVERTWPVPLQELYQCTEGFLGYTCQSGNLHLNEEFIHFECVGVGAGEGRIRVNLTDFTRTTQIFARFRMDDVLEIDPASCPCGRHTLRLRTIEGRCEDIIWLPSVGGAALLPLLPMQLRQAMLLAQDSFEDYRIEQHGMTLRVYLAGVTAEALAHAAIVRQITALCATHGCQTPILDFLSDAGWPEGAKRRRIRCLHQPSTERAGSTPLLPEELL